MSVLQITKSMIALIYSTEVTRRLGVTAAKSPFWPNGMGPELRQACRRCLALPGSAFRVDRTSNAPSDQIDLEVGPVTYRLTVPAH